MPDTSTNIGIDLASQTGQTEIKNAILQIVSLLTDGLSVQDAIARTQIKALCSVLVNNNTITSAQYAEITGEAYTP